MRGPKFCSRKCWRDSVATNEPAPKCQHCNKAFTPAKHALGLFCSKTCYGKQRTIERAQREPLPSSRVFFNTCRVCNKKWTGKSSSLECSYHCHREYANKASTARLERLHKEVAKTTRCKACSCVFSPLYGASHAEFCSPCADEIKSKQKAIHREARKALQRKVATEKVDPYKVFDRDKWTCQECGVHTPRSKRGSYECTAPELDHIQPLSRGGSHSYSNTQCLCRRCNQEKSDTWQPQEAESLLQA